MKQTYVLRNAVWLNATGEKYDAIATPVLLAEILKHRRHFSFDFVVLVKEFIVYKLMVETQPGIIQGLVAFRETPGILHCANMETNLQNQGKGAVYSGVGKAIVGLCCRYSFDIGLTGEIYFDAKNKLFPYYERMGAIHLAGLRMLIEKKDAIKLINLYF